ncbi:STM3941 family protein [Micromonosporaceae bacterium Da 78-11]
MPFLVRLRFNTQYLLFVVVGLLLIAYGLTSAGVIRTVLIVAGAALVLLLGYPILLSVLFRVPLLRVDEAGIRLPLMGPRLDWAEVAEVRQAVRSNFPVLLLVPTDPQAVLGRTLPWLRSESRANLTEFGTPIVLMAQSMNRSLDEIQAAIARHRPA